MGWDCVKCFQWFTQYFCDCGVHHIFDNSDIFQFLFIPSSIIFSKLGILLKRPIPLKG
jgi:hypothetical protein